MRLRRQRKFGERLRKRLKRKDKREKKQRGS